MLSRKDSRGREEKSRVCVALFSIPFSSLAHHTTDSAPHARTQGTTTCYSASPSLHVLVLGACACCVGALLSAAVVSSLPSLLSKPSLSLSLSLAHNSLFSLTRYPSNISPWT